MKNVGLVMINSKYFRIHTDDNAYLTQRPRGLFTAIGKLVDQNKLTQKEVDEYWKNRHWFENNLPVPPFYDDGNTIRAITWYKNTEAGMGMFQKMDFYFSMAEKYEQPLYITQTDISPGKIVYEDDFQIGVVESNHSGESFTTVEYGE